MKAKTKIPLGVMVRGPEMLDRGVREGVLVENMDNVLLLIMGALGEVYYIGADTAEALDFVDHRDRSEPDETWWNRNGPCEISYIDWDWNKWPERTGLSCHGCKWCLLGAGNWDGEHSPYGGSPLCSHPDMLAQHDCYAQSVCGHKWMRNSHLEVSASSCPARPECWWKRKAASKPITSNL